MSVREDPWASGTWEGAGRARLEDTLRATPEQRLWWLEEALRLAVLAGAIPGARDPEDSSPKSRS